MVECTDKSYAWDGFIVVADAELCKSVPKTERFQSEQYVTTCKHENTIVTNYSCYCVCTHLYSRPAVSSSSVTSLVICAIFEGVFVQ